MNKTDKRKTSGSRRNTLKTLALGAGTLAAPALMLKTAHAQSRAVKIGFVSPQTGQIAAFGEADKFVLDGVKAALAKGISIGGKQFPVEIIYKDSQSNPNRAAEVTNQLINNDKCDIILGTSTSDTVNPVASQCELAGVPCITSDNPWQAYFFGRKGDPKKGFEWTYHFFWGFDTASEVLLNMWDSVPSNKIVGSLFSNDPDGTEANQNLPGAFKARGYTVANQGIYTMTSNDFSAQISAMRKANAEIVVGLFTPPAFNTFWTQCGQQGFHPKVVSPIKAMLFPSAVESLGARGAGLTTEVWWSPSHPFKSGLTNQSARQICDDYTKATKRQWTQPLGFKHATLEVAIDVLKRAKALTPDAIRDAIVSTNYQSLVGPIQWKNGPVKNVCLTPLVGGQWKPGKQFKYDLHIVNNLTAKNIPLDSKLDLLKS